MKGTKKTISSIDDLSEDSKFYVKQYNIPIKKIGKNYMRMAQAETDSELTPELVASAAILAIELSQSRDVRVPVWSLGPFTTYINFKGNGIVDDYRNKLKQYRDKLEEMVDDSSIANPGVVLHPSTMKHFVESMMIVATRNPIGAAYLKTDPLDPTIKDAYKKWSGLHKSHKLRKDSELIERAYEKLSDWHLTPESKIKELIAYTHPIF